MGRKLDRLTIHGFKSIKTIDNLSLGSINVLIGANGAGKSNFVEFFKMLREIVEQRLQAYVSENAPSDGFFYNGVSYTKTIEAKLEFGVNGYNFKLKPTSDGSVVLAAENTHYDGDYGRRVLHLIATASRESKLKDHRNDVGITAQKGPNWYVWNSLSDWHVYHFHDTSVTAGMRRDSGVEQGDRLDSNGENLAAFLYAMRENNADIYQIIRKTVQRIAPYFDDFAIKPRKGKHEARVRLMWKQRGKDYVFSPSHLSDGTIRFICLATALLQPDPPATMVVDEPELGLHPEALAILAGLFRSASARMQIIIATQSPVLLSEFDVADVITVDQVDGSSRFQRLDSNALRVWLRDYSLGELWLKGNVRGGVNDA
ncbi:MAG TPA: AAA family ATPase [Phycisphaerales bacterium]|nr:AAA family ATPase [Phycisphaerales bacterium]